MNQYLVSTGTLPLSLGYQFTDYNIIPEAVKALEIDGLEFIFLPEWDKENKPLTPTSANWNEVEKVSTQEVVNFILQHQLPVKTVHANRDIGNYLCSDDVKMINKGQRLLDENIRAATKLNADLVVLHLWDTYKQKLNIKELLNKVEEVSRHHKLDITFENIPVSDEHLTNEKIWNIIKNQIPNSGFTLDINWCSLYNDFNLLIKYIDDIKNIHVHGYVNDKIIFPNNGVLDFTNCLQMLENKDKFITLELMRPKKIEDFQEAIQYMKDNS